MHIKESELECPICYELINKNNLCITSCGHSFHLDCLLKSTNTCIYMYMFCFVFKLYIPVAIFSKLATNAVHCVWCAFVFLPFILYFTR